MNIVNLSPMFNAAIALLVPGTEYTTKVVVKNDKMKVSIVDKEEIFGFTHIAPRHLVVGDELAITVGDEHIPVAEDSTTTFTVSSVNGAVKISAVKKPRKTTTKTIVEKVKDKASGVRSGSALSPSQRVAKNLGL